VGNISRNRKFGDVNLGRLRGGYPELEMSQSSPERIRMATFARGWIYQVRVGKSAESHIIETYIGIF
jgi:hypothetical protein